MKTDASGDELWSKTFGSTGADEGLSVRETTDGDFIIAGRTNSFGAGGNDVYLIKVDSSASEPIPDIKANDSDGPIDINIGDDISVTVELDSGDRDGEDADWWVAESAPDGWYYYSLSTSWTSAGSSYDNLIPTYQGALFDLNTYEVLNTSELSEGTHTFYFAIDTNLNGSLDMGSIYYDIVEVNVTP